MKQRLIKALSLMLVLVMIFAMAVACGKKDDKPNGDNGNDTPAVHTHTYAQTWTYDETNHWHAATCEHTDLKSGTAAHTYGDDNKCTVCGYERSTTPHTHTYAETWTYDDANHWHAATCEHKGEKSGTAAHTFDGNTCTVCGYTKASAGDDDTGNWYDNVDFGGQTLVIQLSKDEADPELPAVKGYIEDLDKVLEGDTGVDKVKNAVGERNREVRSKRNGINVKIQYVYTVVEGYSDYWSHVAPVIKTAESNYASSNKADLYIDLMYDMMNAACEKAVFDNLLKYTKENTENLDSYVGGYFDIQKFNGYNTALMDDMTMTSNRQVLLASDYFLDVIRSMLVLPFNLTIYQGYVTDDPDAEKLYDMALDGDWTWDQLMTYAGVATNAGQATIDDDKLLMAVANGGMMASGFLYSTDYTIYKQNGNTYTLKTSCSELQQLFSKAATLAQTRGVVVLKGESAAVTQANNKFVSGGALFATINMLGILETDDFQSMSGSSAGSLSVMPVPKLKKANDYSTLTNSRARVGALSYHSTNQVAMSAYIQLSTERSDTVKDTYFKDAVGGKYLAGSGANTVLTMIYDNLGNAKNAIIENLILSKDWNVGKDNCWAQLIKADNMTGNQNIQSKMASCVSAKQTVLDKAVAAWAVADVDNASN